MARDGGPAHNDVASTPVCKGIHICLPMLYYVLKTEVGNVVFDPTLGGHGGSKYRGAHGRFIANPNKGKPWYCRESPTGAHHWIITGSEGRCKYCTARREMGKWATDNRLLPDRNRK